MIVTLTEKWTRAESTVRVGDMNDLSPEKTERRAKAAFLALRDAWIDYVNQCEELSHATTRVGTFIALRMDAKKQCSYWPVKKIARMLPSKLGKRMSTRTVSDAIGELVKAGLLTVHRPNRRANQTYCLRMPYQFRDVKNASLSDVENAS